MTRDGGCVDSQQHVAAGQLVAAHGGPGHRKVAQQFIKIMFKEACDHLR